MKTKKLSLDDLSGRFFLLKTSIWSWGRNYSSRDDKKWKISFVEQNFLPKMVLNVEKRILELKKWFEAIREENFEFWRLESDFEGRLEARFTNSTYMENVTSNDAVFLISLNFWGWFEVHFTDSTYMEFVIWAKKNRPNFFCGAKFRFKVKNPVYWIFQIHSSKEELFFIAQSKILC